MHRRAWEHCTRWRIWGFGKYINVCHKYFCEYYGRGGDCDKVDILTLIHVTDDVAYKIMSLTMLFTRTSFKLPLSNLFPAHLSMESE